MRKGGAVSNAASAGYSGTPLDVKLGLKRGVRVRLVNMPNAVRSALRVVLVGCEMGAPEPGTLDFIMVFTGSRAELRHEFERATMLLASAGMIWACWPKKSSKIVKELDDTTVREIGVGSGLVDVKVCAVNETWSGLKFVRRIGNQPSDT